MTTPGRPDPKDPRTHAIIGAAMEVHRVLGPGFLEAVYHEALAIEFTLRGIEHLREVQLPITYKGNRLQTYYKADFVCWQSVIVELKAVTNLRNVDHAQILNYLKATGLDVGLLLNFAALSLEFKRFYRSTSVLPPEDSNTASES